MSLADRIVSDIGFFVQSVAALELELDDLLGLFNSRFDAAKLLAKKYPVQLSSKLKLLPRIAHHVAGGVHCVPDADRLNTTIEIRQRLVHGKVVEIRGSIDQYTIKIAKMRLPEKSGVGQKIIRNHATYSSDDFLSCAVEITCFKEKLEELHRLIFSSGSGWPSYAVVPEGDPLHLTNILRRFERNG